MRFLYRSICTLGLLGGSFAFHSSRFAGNAKLSSIAQSKITTTSTTPTSRVSTKVTVATPRQETRTSLGIFRNFIKGSSETIIEKEKVEDDTPSFALNVPFAVAWIALVTFAFGLAPGELNGPADQAMLERILANPVSPDINELFYTIFNFFAVMPLVVTSIVLPQGRKKGLPAGPFLAACVAVGFFSAGPYLALRAPPLEEIDPSNVSWFTRNVLENKVVHGGLLAFCFYLPFGSGLVAALDDPATLWQGFVHIMTSSRFASVSIADLSLLYASTVALTPRDYMLREPLADDASAKKIAALSALLPFVGTIIYCLWRPSFPQEE